eukprot:4457225-Amphidinium_carterae.1
MHGVATALAESSKRLFNVTSSTEEDATFDVSAPLPTGGGEGVQVSHVVQRDRERCTSCNVPACHRCGNSHKSCAVCHEGGTTMSQHLPSKNQIGHEGCHMVALCYIFELWKGMQFKYTR